MKILHLFEILVSVFREYSMLEFNHQTNAFEEEKDQGGNLK